MRENLTLIFCVLAAFALIFGKASRPPDLTQAFEAYEAAVERGDVRRAARYGELALAAARSSPLFDSAGIARLDLMVGETQAKAGNPQRARELFEQARDNFSTGGSSSEANEVKQKIDELDQLLAERSLRGTITPLRRAGG